MPKDDEIAPTLTALHDAIQAHSNFMAEDDPENIGVVMGALVSWEETRFDSETGRQTYLTCYASTAGSPAMSLGLAVALVKKVSHDTLGCNVVAGDG